MHVACHLPFAFCRCFFPFFLCLCPFCLFFHNVAWCVFVLEGAPREQSPDNRNFPHLSEHIFSLSYSPSLVSRTFGIVIVFSTEIIRRHSTYDNHSSTPSHPTPSAKTKKTTVGIRTKRQKDKKTK